MVLPNKAGILYEKFIKPFKKGENQKFKRNSSNELFSNYKKFINFLENIRKFIIQIIKNNNLYNIKLIIQLKIEDKSEEYPLSNICCKYILTEPILKEIEDNGIEYEDNKILNKNLKNFEIFITDIIEIIYDITIVQENKENKENLPNFSSISSIKNWFTSSAKGNIKQIKIEYHKYKIIDFLIIMQSHTNSVEYIKELNDGTFISVGR